MVPASLTLIEQLPLTSNGKLDRKALPTPSWEEQSEAAFVPPRTPTELRIAEIWRSVLGVERVGANDNFFHIGGHSLLGARVVTQVREQFAEKELADLTWAIAAINAWNRVAIASRAEPGHYKPGEPG